MSTQPELLDAHVVIAPEGDVVCITTSTSAGNIDLADADVLGGATNDTDKTKHGLPWVIMCTTDTWVKLAETSGTAVDKTARTTASANGGAGQGLLLTARTYFKFFFDRTEHGALKTVLHHQADSSAGVIIVARAGQELG